MGFDGTKIPRNDLTCGVSDEQSKSFMSKRFHCSTCGVDFCTQCATSSYCQVSSTHISKYALTHSCRRRNNQSHSWLSIGLGEERCIWMAHNNLLALALPCHTASEHNPQHTTICSLSRSRATQHQNTTPNTQQFARSGKRLELEVR